MLQAERESFKDFDWYAEWQSKARREATLAMGKQCTCSDGSSISACNQQLGPLHLPVQEG